MGKRLLFLTTLTALLLSSVVWAQRHNALDIYFVDVEGGQSTLFVSPSGESMLVDTGFPGERDATRIAAVAKGAGVSQIDYLLITHYHGDHVGGVPELAMRIPIRTFVDHGPTTDQSLGVPQSYQSYVSVRDKGQKNIRREASRAINQHEKSQRESHVLCQWDGERSLTQRPLQPARLFSAQ